MKARRLITVAGFATFLSYFTFFSGVDFPCILRWSAQRLDSLFQSDGSMSSRYVKHADLPDDVGKTNQTEEAREVQVEAKTLRRQELSYFNKEYQEIINLIKQGRPEEADNLFSKLKEEIQTAKKSGLR